MFSGKGQCRNPGSSIERNFLTGENPGKNIIIEKIS